MTGSNWTGISRTMGEANRLKLNAKEGLDRIRYISVFTKLGKNQKYQTLLLSNITGCTGTNGELSHKFLSERSDILW